VDQLIADHIILRSYYNSAGQLCRARLLAKQPNKSLSSRELKQALDIIAPVKERGPKNSPFDDTIIGGNVGWTTYSYDKISVVLIFPVKINPDDRDQTKGTTFDFPNPSTANTKSKTTDDDFQNLPVDLLEVEIKWKNTDCSSL
jgi:hypothetical protein